MLATRKLAPADGLDAETLERWTKLSEHPQEEPSVPGPLVRTGGQERIAEGIREPRRRNSRRRSRQSSRRRRRSTSRTSSSSDRTPGATRPTPSSIRCRSRNSRCIATSSRSRKREAGGLPKSRRRSLLRRRQDRPFPERRMEAAAGHVAVRAGGDEEGPAAAVSVPRDRQGPQQSAGHPACDPRRPEQSRRGGASRLCLDSVQGRAQAFHQRQRPAGAGRSDRGSGESADGAGDGESHLAASLRPGIVETPSNYGQMGARPSNPELLDYLAARFVENKWSIKAMHREIMLSSVYTLSSENLAANAAVDADNRLRLARQLAAAGCRVAARFAAVCCGQSRSHRGRPAGPVQRQQQSPRGLRLRQPMETEPDHDAVRFPAARSIPWSSAT